MNNEIEVRYQEAGGLWQMSTYDNGVNTQSEGGLGEQPAWLQLILDVAKVGGHMKPMREGPPDVILWLRVDTDFNLLEITFP
jgi:hypothetical protein